MTASVVGILFLLALFFAPLASAIPPYATAPAILFVACMMASPLAEIDWKDPTEYAPAVVTALGMPLTYSIATGIGLGLITFIAVKALSGRFSHHSVILTSIILFRTCRADAVLSDGTRCG
jgi:AGZA family xanthine/uracil permease-like MFS transporter